MSSSTPIDWDNIEQLANNPDTNPLLAGWYSLDSAIAHMIIPALTKLIDNAHGYPISPDSFAQTLNTDDPQHEHWLDLLRRMRAGFEAHIKIESAGDDNINDLVDTREDGLVLFATWFQHLWD